MLFSTPTTYGLYGAKSSPLINPKYDDVKVGIVFPYVIIWSFIVIVACLGCIVKFSVKLPEYSPLRLTITSAVPAFTLFLYSTS